MLKNLFSLIFIFFAYSAYAYNTDVFSSDINVINSSDTDKEIGKAIGAFDLLDKTNNLTNRINPNELTQLPIGIVENKSNVQYGLVVTKAKFTPEYALINVYARIVTPQAGAEGGKKTLYFGAENIKLSYNGQIIGDAKLSLLGNIHIPFNSNKWLLTLEGGTINKSTGESINDNTYVTIDCDGFKELAIKGNVQVSREVLLPLDNNGKILPEKTENRQTNRVRGGFALKASDWNDLLVKVDLTPFAITSQTQNKDRGYFSFFVNNAILDLSDLRTDPSVVFPKDYHTYGYLIGGTESWRGLFVQSLFVGLPQEFKTQDHINTPVSFEGQNLLIDAYGVSGHFSANNIFPLEKGLTSTENAWNYSLDKIGIQLSASKIVGANLEGRIALPIQNTNSKNNTSNSNDDNANGAHNRNTLAYKGLISEEQYLISVTSLNDIKFDIWSAKATIKPGSSIEMTVKNREFLPKAILHGELAISANASAKENTENEPTSKKQAEFRGIKFEALTLQTKAPFITAQYFGVQGEQKLAGFPASIKNIFIEANESSANLAFEVTVGLQEQRFSASGGMKINGIISNNHRRQKWEYNGFSLSKLALRNVDTGVATVSGELQLMKNDPLYGNGFMANLSAKIEALKNAEIKVNAAFGYSTFRYWGFEGTVDNLNIKTSVLNITGFTGGAFYRMIPDRDMTINPAFKDKALVLTPDESVGLALRAGVYGSVGDKNLSNIVAGFNISTNPNGGIANIGFMGEAVIMSDLSKLIPSKKIQGVQDKFQQIVSKPKFINDIKEQTRLKGVLDINDVDQQYPTVEKIDGAIYGKLAMNYDFNNSTFHANLDVSINVANNIITGVGPNGKAGWAVLHIAPNEWYLHIGSPEKMIGLKVGFGKFHLQSNSYFMVGNKIPASPPPPAEVAQILGVQLNDIDYMKDLNALGEGKGFAFGTHLKFDTGDMTALFLYARFQAGLGTDIMLKNYGEAKCTNRGGDQIGINGWYANGQAYAYLQGELGIKIKLWMIRKKIPIIKAGVAALLQAKGPNPYWVRGYLGGHYNLLGGLVKGRFRFKMEFGEECKLEKESVLGGMKIITDLTPKKDDTNVDVFAIPQATFAVRVNEPIVIPEDDGDHTYKVVVEKMTIIDDQGKEIKGNIEYANSKDIANFISEDILPPNKTMKALVEVSFMERKNGIYQVVMVDGKKATEVEERSFTTGSAPNHIPLSNIQYAYPVVEQENLYRKETNTGYIKLKRGQDYLFDDTTWKNFIQFKQEKNTKNTDFSYNNGDNIVNFSLPDLDKQTQYSFSIIAKNTNANTSNTASENSSKEDKTLASSGTLDSQNSEEEESSISSESQKKMAQNISKDGSIERLSFSFRTSKYNTLGDKISAMKLSHLWIKQSSDVISLQNDMNGEEYFDTTELIGSKYTDNKPLIQITALMDDEFANKFKNLFYNQYPIDGLTLNRAEREDDFAGIPPVKAFPIFSSYLMFLENDKGNSLLRRTFPYQYDLFSYYKADWYELVSKSANKYINSPAQQIPSNIRRLIESDFGLIPKMKYRAKAQYILPGNKLGSQKEFNFEF